MLIFPPKPQKSGTQNNDKDFLSSKQCKMSRRVFYREFQKVHWQNSQVFIWAFGIFWGRVTISKDGGTAKEIDVNGFESWVTKWPLNQLQTLRFYRTFKLYHWSAIVSSPQTPVQSFDSKNGLQCDGKFQLTHNKTAKLSPSKSFFWRAAIDYLREKWG